MIHVFTVLMWGFRHISDIWHLFLFYRHHHAEQFLRSGVPSQTAHSWLDAYRLLRWLTVHRWSPADW